MVTVLADLRNIYQALLPAHILDPEEEAAAYYSHLNADQGQGKGLTSWLRAAFSLHISHAMQQLCLPIYNCMTDSAHDAFLSRQPYTSIPYLSRRTQASAKRQTNSTRERLGLPTKSKTDFRFRIEPSSCILAAQEHRQGVNRR